MLEIQARVEDLRRHKDNREVQKQKLDADLIQKLKRKEDLLAKYRKLDEVAAGIDAQKMRVSSKKDDRRKSMAIQIVEQNQTDADDENVWTKKNRAEAESDSDEHLTFVKEENESLSDQTAL